MNRTSSIITGGLTLSAATVEPLVSWALNGFPHPIPTSVPLLIAALIITVGHAIYNIMLNRADSSKPAAASPGDKQAGRAMPVLLLILAVGGALALGGCGTLNQWNSAMLTKGAGDYTAAKQNIQKTDDMKLQGWIDAACAMNVGALQRAASTSGNGNAITAVFTACPVPGVGVTSNMPNGSLTVQTTTLQAPPAK